MKTSLNTKPKTDKIGKVYVQISRKETNGYDKNNIHYGFTVYDVKVSTVFKAIRKALEGTPNQKQKT